MALLFKYRVVKLIYLEIVSGIILVKDLYCR